MEDEAHARSTKGRRDAISQSTTASSRGGGSGAKSTFVQFVVAVAQCRRLFRGLIHVEPVPDDVCGGQFTPCVGLQLRQPACRLPVLTGAGAGQVAETARPPVHGVDATSASTSCSRAVP